MNCRVQQLQLYPKALEAREKVWRKEDFSLVKEDWVGDHLGKLDPSNPWGPDGMHMSAKEARCYCKTTVHHL